MAAELRKCIPLALSNILSFLLTLHQLSATFLFLARAKVCVCKLRKIYEQLKKKFRKLEKRREMQFRGFAENNLQKLTRACG